MVIGTTRNGIEQAADAITGHAGTSNPKDVGHAQRTTANMEPTMEQNGARYAMGRALTANNCTAPGCSHGGLLIDTTNVEEYPTFTDAVDSRRTYHRLVDLTPMEPRQ